MEKTIQLIPLYTILLIFSSFIATSDYYSRFGIDIYNYIELSDLLITSLPIFKNIFIAVFTICSMSFSSFMVGYLEAMFKSPRKKIVKTVVDDLRKASNSNTNPPPVSVRQKVWDIENQKIGFHLITDLVEISQPRIRRSFSKSEFWWRIVGYTLIIVILICCTYIFGKDWIEYYQGVQFGQKSFYNNPGKTIAYLIIIPIGLLILYSIFFGGKFLWHALFKKFFRMEIIPIVVIGIFTVTSLLSNYADYLNVTKDGKTNYYRIYLKGSVIASDPKSYRYIGRTKTYVFLFNKQKVKSINIAEADSIIVKASNRIK